MVFGPVRSYSYTSVRLSAEKNLSLLVGMLAELERRVSNEFHLLLVGDGPYREKLKTEIRKLHRRSVILAGPVADKDQLADIYANADAFVHPNPREPFGIAPLEAMASGVPLVAPNSGGVLSYANSDNAWLASPDPIEFTRALSSALECDDERRRRVGNALAKSQEYCWETSTDERFAIYDQMYEMFVGRHQLFDYAPARLRDVPLKSSTPPAKFPVA